VNLRSTPEEVAAWREAATAEHLDLTTWLRRLAWAAVDKWRSAQGKPKVRRERDGKRGGKT